MIQRILWDEEMILFRADAKYFSSGGFGSETADDFVFRENNRKKFCEV